MPFCLRNPGSASAVMECELLKLFHFYLCSANLSTVIHRVTEWLPEIKAILEGFCTFNHIHPSFCVALAIVCAACMSSTEVTNSILETCRHIR